MSATATSIHLYWATGCTSCLRIKEFLKRNNTSFVSHNVIQKDGSTDTAEESSVGIQGVDPEIMDEMADLGLPSTSQSSGVVRSGPMGKI